MSERIDMEGRRCQVVDLPESMAGCCAICGRSSSTMLDGSCCHPDCFEGSIRGHRRRFRLDAGGHAAVPMSAPKGMRGPCLVCGVECAVTFDGFFTHLPCFENSALEQRLGALAPTVTAAEKPAPALAQDHPATAPTPAAAGATASAEEEEVPQPEQVRPTVAPTPAALAAAAAPAAGGLVQPSVPARTKGRFAGPAIVVDVEVIGLPDGSEAPLPWPVTGLKDVLDLAVQYRVGCEVRAGHSRRTEDAQVWLMPGAIGQLGLDLNGVSTSQPDLAKLRERSRELPAFESALAHGWVFAAGGPPEFSRWTRLKRGSQRVWIVLVPMLDPAMFPLITGAGPGLLARRLALYADLVGYPLKLTPQTTAADHLSVLRSKDRELVFAPEDVLEGVFSPEPETETNWSRVPSAAELALPYVHGYDRGAAYLAGMSGGLKVGVGRPEFVEGDLEVSKEMFGLHQIETPGEAPTWTMPNPLDPNGRALPDPVWRTSMTIWDARQRGMDPVILGSWIWPETAPIFQSWYEQLRKARVALYDGSVAGSEDDVKVLREELKLTYSRYVGNMDSQTYALGKDHYAPSRRAAIIARARINLARLVEQIGSGQARANGAWAWPLAWRTDTIVYASVEPDPIKAWPGDPAKLGRGVGQMHWAGSARMAEHAEFFTGHRYAGLSKLSTSWPGEAR